MPAARSLKEVSPRRKGNWLYNEKGKKVSSSGAIHFGDSAERHGGGKCLVMKPPTRNNGNENGGDARSSKRSKYIIGLAHGNARTRVNTPT